MMTVDSRICIRGSLISLLRQILLGTPWEGEARNSPRVKEVLSRKIEFLLPPPAQPRIHNSLLPWNHRIGSIHFKLTPRNPHKPFFPTSVRQITNLPPNPNNSHNNNSRSRSLLNRRKTTRARRGGTAMGNGCLSSEIVVMGTFRTYPPWGICIPVKCSLEVWWTRGVGLEGVHVSLRLEFENDL